MSTFRFVALAAACCLSGPVMGEGPALAAQADATIRAALHTGAYDVVSLEVPADVSGQVVIEVPLGAESMLMRLSPRSLRSEQFRVLVDDGRGAPHEVRVDAPRTYSGVVEGVDDSWVAVSIIDGQVAGMIFTPVETYSINPVSEFVGGLGADQHVISRGGDFVPGDWTCVELANPDGDDAGWGQRGNCSAYNNIEIAFDADVEFYNRNGSSVNNTIADIENVMNGVTNIYERDCNATFTITQIIVRTVEQDPYSSTNSSTLLNQFRSEWQNNQGSIQRDLAHLMTGKNIDGSVIGIAWLTAVCTSNGYGLSESRFTNGYNARVALTAHEIGHNCSAPHCNGNGDCHIMCSGLGGCNGLGLPNFGVNVAPGIANYVANRPCVNCADGTSSVNVTSNIGAPSVAASPADNGGSSGGVVPFSLHYLDGTGVTLTAQTEIVVDSVTSRVRRWKLNGVDQPEGGSLFLTVNADTNVQAVYEDVSVAHITADPVDVAVSFTTDLDGVSGGATPIDATYWLFGGFTLTAPLTSGDYEFDHWRIAGFDYSEGLNSLPVSALFFDFDAIAFYNLVSQPCDADLDGDGDADGIDIGLFLSAYAGQQPEGDFNGDGQWNGIDVGLFLSAYAQGC